MQDYERSVAKSKQDEAMKKTFVKNMMQVNREKSKIEQERRQQLDESLNHLINPIEFQMMD